MQQVHYPAIPTAVSAPLVAGPGLRQRHAQELVRRLGEPLISGNRVELIADDEAGRAAIFDAIDGAGDHINVEACASVAGDELLQRLAERCRRGIRINVLVDAAGAAAPGALAALRTAGASVCVVHGEQPWRAWANEKLPCAAPRRLLVADGRVGVVGGGGVRDLHVRAHGPVLQRLQRLFIAHWQRAAETPMQHARYFPALAPAGTQRVGVAGCEAGRINPFGSALLGAVETARRSVALTIADAVPAPALHEALRNAARRGVDVELLLPAPPAARLTTASPRRIDALVAAGVRVLHRHAAASLHAEACAIDGVWAGLGCARLGWRNLLQPSAADLVVLDEGFAAPLARLLHDEARRAVRADRAEAPAWRRWTAALARRFEPRL